MLIRAEFKRCKVCGRRYSWTSPLSTCPYCKGQKIGRKPVRTRPGRDRPFFE